MRKFLFALSLLCLASFSQAQLKFPSLDFKPQGPTTAAFTRYGDVPVDLSTGVPGISIPIYTLSGRGVEVPVSISYHASGIKVQDIASVVGLGWTLNAGGVITRSVFGSPDERLEMGSVRPPWKNTTEFMAALWAGESENPDEFYWNLYDHYLTKTYSVDFHSDRYYYSLGNGESGVFRRDFVDNTYKFIPYKPNKVRFYWAENNGNLKAEIITAEGTKYTFKRNFYDLWYPEKIVNNSNTDSIVFYTRFEQYSAVLFDHTAEFGPYKNTTLERTEPLIQSNPESACWDRLQTEVRNINNIHSQPYNSFDEIILIDSIVGSNARIQFTYAKDRQDTYFTAIGNQLSRLTKVQVFSVPTGTMVKEVNLSHSYSGESSDPLTKRLMLDAVQTGVNGDEKYSFTYNPDYLPPYLDGMTPPTFHEDFWGYKNNGGGMTNIYDEFAPNGISDRFPDDQKAQACILQEIKYPTGGKTKFEYECNRVNPGFYGYGFTRRPADGKVGGLRVKKISNFAYEGATPQVKTYEYISNLNPGDYGSLQLSNFVYTQETLNFYLVDGCNWQVWPQANITHMNKCTSNPMGRYIGSARAPVVYDLVTEYNGDPTHNTGKIVYNYQLPNDHFDDAIYDPRFTGPWHVDEGNYTPLLLQKSEYKNENGQYKLVRKTENSYTSIQSGSFSTGFNLGSDLLFNNMLRPSLEYEAAWYYFIYNHNSWYSNLHYNDDVAYTDLKLPQTTSVYDYIDGNNFVKTTSEFSYNQYGQQTAVSTSTSKGDELTTKFTYPVDYATQAPYDTMVARNILTPVIEQSSFKNSPGNFLQSQKTNYGYWNFPSQNWNTGITNQILPQTIETKKGANDVETRIQYFSYDEKGNPIYVGKENDTRQLYLWDYNKAYPVAQVMNVTESDKRYVVYNSFEAVTSWSPFQGTIIDDNTAPTGKKCLSLIGINSFQYALNSNKSYILSYWYKAGSSISVAANSTVLANPPAKNGWVFMKRKISGSPIVGISGSGYIDELRLYPETAQMTTFAYEPLVGITAQCDINDKIIYYSYDASGRLSLVKDDNGNILKKVCYNFQGQPDACGENAVPLWQLTGVTRCKPCPQNSNYFTTLQQREERDNNPNSDTYGNVRWVDGEVSGACVVPPDWQNTANTRCVTVNNQNTGEQQREQKDVNPCSGSVGQTRWVSAGTNTTACPLPPLFLSAPINRNYYKQNCGSQQIPLPYLVNLPEGAYTSANNPAEANALAEQEAQRQANVNGQCMTVYVKMVVVPRSSDEGPEYGYADFHFQFYSNAAGTNSLILPSNLVINIRDHAYAIYDGQDYEDWGNRDINPVANAGVNEYVLYNEQIQNCGSPPYCFYNDWSLLPGNYVIIP